MQKTVLIAAVIAVLTLPWVAPAATVTLTANDSGAESSFSSGLHWSDGQPPSPGNDYFTGAYTLQTPSGAANATFAGDALTVDSGGRVYYIGAKNGSITIDNFILNGGKFQTSRVAANDYASYLYGNITLAEGTTSTLSSPDSAVRHTINVYAPISGDGNLHLQYRMRMFFYAKNTYTGDTIIDAWAAQESSVTFNGGSEFLFAISNKGVNNQLRGTGTLNLNGRLNIDKSGSTAPGTWTLIDTTNFANLTYGATFSIGFVGKPSFTSDAGVWTSANKLWTFTQNTGVLESKAQAATLLLLK